MSMKYFARGELRIRPDQEEHALAAIKRFGQARPQLWGWVLEVDSFEEILNGLEFAVRREEGIYFVAFGGRRDVDEDEAFFTSFVQYLSRGSFIQYVNENCDVWRFVEKRSKLVRKEPQW